MDQISKNMQLQFQHHHHLSISTRKALAVSMITFSIVLIPKNQTNYLQGKKTKTEAKALLNSWTGHVNT